MIKLLLWTAVFLAQLGRPACSAESGAEKSGGYNVVMIVMETLRRDHLSCYGYYRKTTPNIDGLSAEGVVFENAFAQSSQSLISAASVFTGLYPPAHGVVSVRKSLAPGTRTLAGELKRHGYKTAAFTGGFFLNHNFGLDRGFEVYEDSNDFGMLSDAIPPALNWMRRNKAVKFFLLVHGYDCHAPYRAPGEFLGRFDGGYDGPLKKMVLDYNLADRIYENSIYEDFRLKKKIGEIGKKDVDYIVSQYDGAVLYADTQIGALLAEMKSLGLKDKTIVLFMASAGEALMDHGTIISSFHGLLYDEGIHVPFIIRVPGISAFRSAKTVQLVDVMPTVMDLLRLGVPRGLQGVSLSPALEGRGESLPERAVYAETLSIDTRQPCIGIRKYPWKLISVDGRYELFNLADDPGEKKNIADKEPSALRTCVGELDRVIGSIPRRRILNDRKPSAVVEERMKAMGYWWMDRPRARFWGKLDDAKER